MQFIASKSALYAYAKGTYQDTNALANITVLGVEQGVDSVSLNGNVLPPSSVKYNVGSKVLIVTGLNNATKDGAWSSDWVLNWD